MVAMLQKKWSKCGWLLGARHCLQPLVALTVPLVHRRPPLRGAVCARSPVGCAFSHPGRRRLHRQSEQHLSGPSQATDTSSGEPCDPLGESCPEITSGVKVTGHSVHSVIRSGRSMFTEVTTSSHTSAVVAGGPGRLLDVLVAVLLGCMFGDDRRIPPDSCGWSPSFLRHAASSNR